MRRLACTVGMWSLFAALPAGNRAAASDRDRAAELLSGPVSTQPRQPEEAESPVEPVLRLAAVLPLTGELGPYGLSARRGVEVAVKRVNQSGGVAGRPVRLMVLDSQSRADQAGHLATRTIAVEQAEAIIGGLTGPEAWAIRPVAEQRRTVFMALACGWRLPGLGELGGAAEGDRYTFQAGVSDVRLAEGLACYARQALKVERAFVVSDVTGDQPTAVADSFAVRFTRLGGQVAGIESIRAGRDSPTLAEVADRVRRARADVVFASGQPEQVARLGRAIRAGKSESPLLLIARFWAMPLTAGEPSVPPPAYCAVAFAEDDPADQVRRFAADLARDYPQSRPDVPAALACDSVLMLVEAVRQRARRGGELRERLLEVRGLAGVAGPMEIDPSGQVLRPVAICRFGDGPGQPSFVQHVRPATGQPTAIGAASQPAEQGKPAPPRAE